MSDPSLIDLAVALARVEERQELAPDILRGVVREAVTEALEPLTARVATLEKEVARGKAYSAALASLAGAAAWAAEHFHLLPVLALGLVAGCGAARPDAGGLRWAGWAKPVTVVIADDLPAHCQDAALQAVDFWTDLGVDYLEVQLGLYSRPAGLGEISFRFGELEEPTIGFTQWRASLKKKLLKVDITLEQCDRDAAAHELGHALGLDDTNRCPSLMCYYENGSLEVFDDELEAVL